MAHWRSLIEKDFLGAWDLVDAQSGKPREFTLKIVKVASELLKTKEQPKGKRKAVIRFDRATKALVANSTNCEVIAAMYGSDIEAWIGKSITLYQADVRDPRAAGTVKGIRVRPRKPSGPAEAIEGQPVDRAMRDEQDAAYAREPGQEG
jgi:hypothetical protein